VIGLAVGAGLAIVVLAVAFGIRRTRQRHAEQERQLVQSGFRRCEAEEVQLAEVVRSMHESSSLEVHKPWKREGAEAAFYWYEVASPGSHDHQRVAADEFLCTIKRSSKEPFALFLSPVRIERGFGSKMLESVLSLAAPAGLHKLEVPESLRSRGVYGAFGPQGASIQDLVDEGKLAVLSDAGRHGIFAIRGDGERCAMELTSAYGRKASGRVSWQDTWSFVQRAAG